MHVLIIEDYMPTLNSVQKALADDGHAVSAFADGEEGFLAARYNHYDAIILDIMLPSMNGMEILRKLRKSGNNAQIIMLTAKDSQEEIIEGLDSGADDYIVKPFSMDEVRARIRACERRRFQKRSPIMTMDNGLEVNLSQRSVMLKGKPVKLTPKEYSLLHLFVMREDEVVTRQDIMDSVYDAMTSVESNVVDVYVARLRKKLTIPGEAPIIETLRGHGYILRSA